VCSVLTKQTRASAISSGLAETWRTVVYSCFLLLCLRVQISAIRSAGANLGPIVFLIAGALILGAWNPKAALFAFSISVPTLMGLSNSDLLACAFPPCLVFSALWSGIAARRGIKKRFRSHWIIDGEMRTSRGTDYEQRAKDFQTHRRAIDIESLQFPFCAYLPRLVTSVLISAVLISLATEIWKHYNSTALWPVLANRPIMGFGDSWYFLTSAFLWLQGLFYFAALSRQPRRLPGRDLELDVTLIDVAGWVGPVIASYGINLFAFTLMQIIFHIPEGWAGAGLQAPYEDISSYGSIAVSVFIFSVATSHIVPKCRLAVRVVACISLFAMVIASWSRGAWLAGLVFLLLIAVFRLSRVWITALILSIIGFLVVVNLNATRSYWVSQPYLARLVALARFENPAKKSIERVNLYDKAARMIRDRPLIGHGIGSFYLKSTKYADPRDPVGNTPDFAHNVFFQIAVEQGVPIAVLFAAMLTWVLWLGIYTWIKQRAAPARCPQGVLTILGITLALGAYIQTQLTANSLNVYTSNQFFFWLLVAALLATHKRLDSVDRDDEKAV
jgi:O-antigen ligase